MYDVVVIGAGPAGITTASALAALGFKVAALDKRPVSTRGHGLEIRGTAVENLQRVLLEILESFGGLIGERLASLNKILDTWKWSFVKTSKIEEELSKNEFGVDVFRGKQYEITPDNLDIVLSEDEAEGISETDQRLKEIFKGCKVVVGADGAHSVVRKAVFGDRLIDHETLRYIVELKYETDGDAVPRGYKVASFESSVGGHVNFESMNRHALNEKKPVTVHIFVDKETYDHMRVVNGQGEVLKGDFAHSWTLEELEAQAAKDPKVALIYQMLNRNLSFAESRGATHSKEKISTVDVTYFQSEESVKNYLSKAVIILGDARAGMVYQQGFNKALLEIAAAIEAICGLLKNTSVKKLIFTKYERTIREIFATEKAAAERKNIKIASAESVVGSTAASIRVTSSVLSALFSTLFPSSN